MVQELRIEKSLRLESPRERVDDLYKANEGDDKSIAFLDAEFEDKALPLHFDKLDTAKIERNSRSLLGKVITSQEVERLYGSPRSSDFGQVSILVNPESYKALTDVEVGWVVIVTDGNKRPIARTKRIVRKNEVGEVVLFKDHLYLTDDYQGHGIGTLFHEREEEWCRENGIDKCTIETEQVGGYVWAMMGYDFMHDEERVDLSKKMRRYCREHHLVLEEDLLDPDLDRDERRELLLAEQEEWKDLRERAHSWDLASLVAYDREGSEVRVGKECMLNEHWAGERDLRSSSPSERQHKKYMAYLKKKKNPQAEEKAVA